ncbi:conserved hypothetical protein [Deferribacter desulfuricans SSM1]|uniref:7-carboxy-7-deazaguanine synthase n=1 Tax=Deferribacter desulfuricans (strain DSM 14783 / JCM 11476 / NBRC 101012 / SSM1) TaxID=639282 RepID=D3PD05_DEFDS|nr:7-carboxy-7-deazaguanine synthase QueE [Deferribacter desulfuricans]BAI80478.1 conserved hypothetical protein [Deferribacter desulfuricans SSM1]
MSKAFVKEIFKSVQGEGKYVGARQLFIRFAGCNINCVGCDTNYTVDRYFLCCDKKYENPVTPDNLFNLVVNNFDLNLFHSVSLTGGEPLIYCDFLKLFLQYLKNAGVRTFLETSGLIVDSILELEDYLDIISVDLKLKEVFGVEFNRDGIIKLKDINEKVYFKIVVGENLPLEKIENTIHLIKGIGVEELYIHFIDNKFNYSLLDKILDLCYYHNVMAYFIPQVHKLIGMK